jgi:hypothetical protein
VEPLPGHVSFTVNGRQVREQLAGGGAALVAWKLETGRTHQIRCAGLPVRRSFFCCFCFVLFPLASELWGCPGRVAQSRPARTVEPTCVAQASTARPTPLLTRRACGVARPAAPVHSQRPAASVPRCAPHRRSRCVRRLPRSALVRECVTRSLPRAAHSVHARHLGHPLLGDDTYGGGAGPAAAAVARAGAVSQDEVCGGQLL